MNYNDDYYVLTVETENGKEIEIKSTEFRYKCCKTRFLEGIEYIDEVKKVDKFGTSYEGLKKPYAVIPEQQKELERLFEKKKEEHGVKVIQRINNGIKMESLKREDASLLPISYGMYICTLSKSDIDKLLHGDILYCDDEYTFAIGMKDEDIKHEAHN